ncbi:hypothetical protein AMELA_G00244910 [Ameiurus melas]|uniref:Uncharacterized protein n=1 Tax=Ameiurus melas TaxID=219545 RepID=A0A7J5ZVA6_AMEME|nr:hypothetical protein AMELA_G00244910 [Ameiurus melas]
MSDESSPQKCFSVCGELNKANKLWLLNFQDTLAEAVAKYVQAMESNTESEKSDLKYHVHKMKGAVQKLEKLLDEVEISCDMIKPDREREQEAYNILKSQYEEALNSVMNY